jgi:hypothetical protein
MLEAPSSYVRHLATSSEVCRFVKRPNRRCLNTLRFVRAYLRKPSETGVSP